MFRLTSHTEGHLYKYIYTRGIQNLHSAENVENVNFVGLCDPVDIACHVNYAVLFKLMLAVLRTQFRLKVFAS
jgi:hypothetical protein